MNGDDPLVALFLQPGIIKPPALKVTFDATLTSAEIVVLDPYTAELPPPLRPNELKEDGVEVLA